MVCGQYVLHGEHAYGGEVVVAGRLRGPVRCSEAVDLLPVQVEAGDRIESLVRGPLAGGLLLDGQPLGEDLEFPAELQHRGGIQGREAVPQGGTVPLQNVNLVPRRHSGQHGTPVPKSVWREALETHLIHFQVGALPLEEPVYRLVLAPPEEHENRLAGDRHLEGTPDHRDRVPGDADLHAGQLFDDSSRLPPRADEPRPDLGDPILGVREVFDIEDLQVALVVEETERPVFATSRRNHSSARGWSSGTAWPTSITMMRSCHQRRLYSLMSAWTSFAFRMPRKFVTTSR